MQRIQKEEGGGGKQREAEVKVSGLILGIIEFTVSTRHQEKDNPILGPPVCPRKECNVDSDKYQTQNAGDTSP